jgi:hypothetical protein
MTAAAWDPTACDRQVRRLAALADDLQGVHQRLDRLAGALGGWTGTAAARARVRLAQAAVAVSVLTGLVRRSADAVWLGLSGITEAVRLARLPAQEPDQPAEAAALAAFVDTRVAAALGLIRAGHAGSAGRLPLPANDALPREVALWWTELPPHLRDSAVTGHSDVVSRLAGLPATVRDAANRIVLGRQLRLLRAEWARLQAGICTDPDSVRYSAGIAMRLRLAEAVAGQLAELDRSRTRGTLLTLDLDGAGRVAIGVGDLDSAQHVGVVVPGMGQDAGSGLARTVQQAVRLRDRAGGESAESVATLAWTGYAAPGLLQVPFPIRARVGGRSLTADLVALTAARHVAGSDPPQVTVVGHSYGSTLVGAAATAGPLAADDLVLLGSPGVLADGVEDLHHRPERVYVGEARFDPIADLGAFGADPGDAEFGAIRIAAEPGPDVPWTERVSGGHHSHYYDPDSESLRNVARIVVGRGADTTRPAD